jgi:hypothetical protein
LSVSTRDVEPSPLGDLTSTLSLMSLRDDASDRNCPSFNARSLLPRHSVASNVQFQPTIAMYPFMVQPPFVPAYMVDGFPLTGQTSPVTPISPRYPIVGSLYQTPPSPAPTSLNNQSPSRSVSGYGRADARRQHAARVNRSPHHSASGHHNHVDIQRIRDGIDVRTTVSIKQG